jgi:hypothetical protein
VDDEREIGRILLACIQDNSTQEKTPIQRGHTETHGGSTTQAMGVPESLRASGLNTIATDQNSESAGLCADCQHARVIRSDRGSIFYLCRLSATDPRFAKYPRLPVLSCPGYQKPEPASP